MTARFEHRTGEKLIASQFVSSKDLKLALDNTLLSEEDGKELIEHVTKCRNLEKIVFPNLIQTQRATFARRLQGLPLRSISFNINSVLFGEVCPMLGQSPLRTISISSQSITPNDTMQLSRLLSKGTINSMQLIDCTFEDMEAFVRGLHNSKVSKFVITAPTVRNDVSELVLDI